MANIKKLMDKGVAYYKRNGFRKTYKRIIRKLILTQDVDYEKWLQNHTPSQDIMDMQRRDNTGEKPVVCVKILAKNPEMKERTLESVLNQTYGFLAVSDQTEHADYYLVLREGVQLREDAVYEMVKASREQPDVDLFYTDDDVLLFDKYQDPFFKPEFDECMYLQWDYLGDALFAKKEVVERVKNPADFDELVSQAEKVGRIPQILAHTNGQYRLIRKLVDRALSEEPKVSVIIPNKDHAADLEICIESLIQKGGHKNLEILIVENNSEETETFDKYKELSDRYGCIRVLEWKDAFHYSAINNYAAIEATGEYLLLLNNDTKVKSDGFLQELIKWASISGCGAIGCRLLYKDETIQHGGVVLGYGGIAGHAFEGMTDEAYENTLYSGIVRRMTAVTAACMLVKKQAFLEVGSFAEELKVAYNDIDLCMKLQQAGYMVLYDPYAVMYHYESQTRGFEMTTEKAKRVQQEAQYFCDQWKEALAAGDRFYNPNLTLEKPDFSIDRK